MCERISFHYTTGQRRCFFRSDLHQKNMNVQLCTVYPCVHCCSFCFWYQHLCTYHSICLILNHSMFLFRNTYSNRLEGKRAPQFYISISKDTHLSSQSLNRHFIEHRRAAASLAHSMTTGAWGDLTETLRPGTAAPLGPAGGGNIQGAAPVRRPSTTGSMGRYEAQKQLKSSIVDVRF